MNHPANTLRSELNVASRAVQQFGATPAQIDMIVALAQGANDYNVLSGGALTKAEASRIIEQFKAEGATPDWTDHREVPAARDFAAAKMARAQEKARKAHRVATVRAEALDSAGETARRVSHPKLGAGTVVAEDGTAVTVVFDGQKKPVRVAASFLTDL